MTVLLNFSTGLGRAVIVRCLTVTAVKSGTKKIPSPYYEVQGWSALSVRAYEKETICVPCRVNKHAWKDRLGGVEGGAFMEENARALQVTGHEVPTHPHPRFLRTMTVMTTYGILVVQAATRLTHTGKSRCGWWPVASILY